MRVLVPWGKRKICTGIIISTSSNIPSTPNIKEIIDVPDEQGFINEHQIQLVQWMAKYYLCHEGEVLNALLPSGLKLSSESIIHIHDEYHDGIALSNLEHEVIELVMDKPYSLHELEKILKKNSLYAIVKTLLHKNAIIISEQVNEKYRPKFQTYIRIKPLHWNSLHDVLTSLEKKKKQKAVLEHYLQSLNQEALETSNASGIIKSDFLKQFPYLSSLNTLIKEQVFEAFQKKEDRIKPQEAEEKTVCLSSAQQKAVHDIEVQFKEHHTLLLHGITGSGKTEIYIEQINAVLAQGKQVLFLVPEIALTTQLMNRLAKYFGAQMGVYHSKFSENERVEVYEKVLQRKINFILGVRSSIFLPFHELGLVIVDEEHDSSYKQQNPAPRYNARDCAIYLATLYDNTKVILGSATPSLESYKNAQDGKYGYVHLEERYGDAALPSIHLINLKKAKKQRTEKLGFAWETIDQIKQTIALGKQVIIFQNRRGYAPVLECQDCAAVPQCPHCSVSLTLHAYKKELRCHYCGYTEHDTSCCKQCGSTDVITVGTGTEKIEQDIQTLIPEALTLRLDQDTTKNKHGHENILTKFKNREANILIGTQMVVKGLDFDHVELVVIYHADRMWNFPDFRSIEKSFQNLIQVSGRAGRKSDQGKVLIQTYDPEHLLFTWVRANSYQSFANYELQERHALYYPPYSKLVKIELRAVDKNMVKQGAQTLVNFLRTNLIDSKVLGPETPSIERINNFYIQVVFIKLDKKNSHYHRNKTAIQYLSHELLKDTNFKNIKISVDVDPLQ